MGILSKLENKMEDGIEGAAGALGGSSLSPVQITKKAEKQMRREKIVGAGKQYAPTLYTVLVSPEDDSKLFKYYPTLAGETETYLMARARETGYVMDGHPLVRFLADPDLKRGKFDVVAEVVAANTIQRLRDDEMRRYGLPTRAQSGHRRQALGLAPQEPNMQPLQNLEAAGAVAAADASGAALQASSEPEDSRERARRMVDLQVERQREQARAFEERQIAAQQGLLRQDPMEEVAGIVSSAQAALANADSAADGMADVGIDKGVAIDVSAGAAVGAVGMANSAGVANAAGAVNAAGAAGFASSSPEAAAPTMELHVYLYDEARDTAYTLTGAVQTIGRESSNDIVVPDINISRMHAQISRDPDGVWTVADLNSTNGLFVNGRRVRVAQLRDADMITLGTSTLEFQLLG